MSITIKTNNNDLMPYIQKALKHINPDSERIKSNNSYYYQNRIIDCATRLFIADKANFNYIYDYWKPDIITDNARALHYGTAIGTQVGYITIEGKDYFIKIASIKNKIRKLVRAMRV